MDGGMTVVSLLRALPLRRRRDRAGRGGPGQRGVIAQAGAVTGDRRLDRLGEVMRRVPVGDLDGERRAAGGAL
jgi:hypothetical protein